MFKKISAETKLFFAAAVLILVIVTVNTALSVFGENVTENERKFIVTQELIHEEN